MEAKKADARLQMSHETDQKTEKMVLVLRGGRGVGDIYFYFTLYSFTFSLINQIAPVVKLGLSTP